MYLTQTERYTELRSLLLQNNLQPKYTKQVKKGICFQMRDADDFRKLRKLMDHHGMERFTFKLEEEKPLKVVVRGASKLLTTDEIEDDLRRQDIPFSRVARLRKNRTEDYDMVMITTDRTSEGKKVFELKNIQGLRVSVEPKRKSSRATQCFKCQEFGHGQGECTAQFRCAFCARNHSSWTCPEEKGPGKPALCCNCNGRHPAFFTTCPKHPLNIRREQDQRRHQQWQASQRVEGRSYAAQVAGQNRSQPPYSPGPNTTSPTVNLNDLERIITQVIQRLVPAQFLNINHGYQQ